MKSSLQLKKIGIWTAFEKQPASKLKEAVAELEQLGYGAVWYSEGLGRESLTQAGLLLSASSRMVIATGITNIYGRDPVTAASGQKTLSEAYPDRFVLGLGVSHIPLVESLRGHAYEKPVAKMIRAAAWVVPVSLAGTQRLMRKGDWTIHPGEVFVRYGHAINAAEYSEDQRDELRQRIQESVAAGLPEEQQPLARN